ncbi:hypothetical protein [Nocardia sp. NPDC049149]|uniref:hypothetical protein n=1 Tax=Nocardia sp. NPDC049149 TaxID=3364315 RepID=UPI0037204092
MAFVIVGASAPATAVSMGMNKNGVQAVPSNPDIKLVNWTVRPGYPGTVIENHELVASGPGTATVRCGVELSANMSAGQSLSVMLMVNNATVQTGTIGSFSKSVELDAKVVTLAAGDKISVHVGNEGSFNGPNVVGGATTYVYFDVTP